MAITIINLTKSPLAFNLGLPDHCKRVRLQRFDYDRSNGHRYTRRVHTSIATTLDLGPREAKSNLPDAYKREVEIANALKAKKIRIIEIAEGKPTPNAAPETSSTPNDTPPTSSPVTTPARSPARRIAPTTGTKES